jgi:hypothetical protein
MEGRELHQVACSGWLPPLTASAWPGQKEREVGRCCGGSVTIGDSKLTACQGRSLTPRLEPNTGMIEQKCVGGRGSRDAALDAKAPVGLHKAWLHSFLLPLRRLSFKRTRPALRHEACAQYVAAAASSVAAPCLLCLSIPIRRHSISRSN